MPWLVKDFVKGQGLSERMRMAVIIEVHGEHDRNHVGIVGKIGVKLVSERECHRVCVECEICGCSIHHRLVLQSGNEFIRVAYSLCRSERISGSCTIPLVKGLIVAVAAPKCSEFLLTSSGSTTHCNDASDVVCSAPRYCDV